MTGSSDVAAMLRTLEVVARPDEYVYATLPVGHPAVSFAAATITEREGLTAVLRRSDADQYEVKYEYVAAWLTLSVHSALESVGLTSALSQALSQAGISANVLAGYFHDHILVPACESERAIAVLHELRGAR